MIELLVPGLAESQTIPVWVESDVTTDAAGMYQMPHQSTCPVRLAAVVPGQGRGEENVPPIEDGGAVPYDFQRDIIMIEAVDVTGQVVDWDGNPIEGCVVCTRRLLSPSDIIRAQPGDLAFGPSELLSRLFAMQTATDEFGRFRLPSLAPGQWSVTADSSDQGMASEDITVPFDSEEGEILLVLSVSPWVISLSDEEHRPIPGASLLVMNLGCRTHSEEGRTSDAGLLEINGVDPSRASVLVEELPGYPRIRVVNERGALFFPVELPSEGGIRGRISPHHQDERVTLMCPPSRIIVDATEDTDETLMFDGLPPGDHLCAISTKHGLWTLPRNIHVESGRVTDIGIINLDELTKIDSSDTDKNWDPMNP
jgi:hypothetical protein